MHADAVEDLRVADDIVARVRGWAGIQPGEDFEETGNRAQTRHHHLLPGNDRGCGAQVGIDGHVGGGVAHGLIFDRACSSTASIRWLFQSMRSSFDDSKLRFGSHLLEKVINNFLDPVIRGVLQRIELGTVAPVILSVNLRSLSSSHPNRLVQSGVLLLSMAIDVADFAQVRIPEHVHKLA